MIKYCHAHTDVPAGEHWVILTFSSVTVPGDERSRLNPGHGYPEHTLTRCEYIAFDDRSEWEAEVVKRSERTWENNFVAFRVAGLAVVNKQVSVTVAGDQ